MSNYLRIYDSEKSFYKDYFKLPYPCVSCVDEVNRIEFEGTDKVRCVVEIPQDVMDTQQEVKLAEFNNPASVSLYAVDENFVEVDVPTITVEDVVVTFDFMEGVFIPSFAHSFDITQLTSELRWKSSRPLTSNDALMVMMYSGGTVVDGIDIPYDEMGYLMVHHGNNEYGMPQEVIDALKSEEGMKGVSYAFAFVDEDYISQYYGRKER